MLERLRHGPLLLAAARKFFEDLLAPPAVRKE